MIYLSDLFNQQDINIILEAISDIKFVSYTTKSLNFLKENSVVKVSILKKFNEFELENNFFKEWGFYEKKSQLSFDEVKFLLAVLRMTLSMHTDQQLTTYVGANRVQLERICDKLEFILGS